MCNPKIGLEAQKRGREAEERVIDELSRAGWGTEVSPELDHGRKTDVVAICPSEKQKQFPLQVSTGDKSSGQQRRLAERDIVPVSLETLDKKGQTAPEFLCNQCPLREQCHTKISTALGARALASI